MVVVDPILVIMPGPDFPRPATAFWEVIAKTPFQGDVKHDGGRGGGLHWAWPIKRKLFKKSQNKGSFERKNPPLLSLKNGISFSASFLTCYFRPIKTFDKRVIWRRSSISFWIRSSNTRVKEMITSLLDNLPPLRGCVWVRALSRPLSAPFLFRTSVSQSSWLD